MSLRLLGCALALATCGALPGQNRPEILYYQFNEGVGTLTSNVASPGQGASQGTLLGHALAPAPAGQFGDGALVGTGSSSLMDTGWTTNLTTGAFTVGFWLDLTAVPGPNVFMHLFGDQSAGNFRAFANGAAGLGNVLLRGGGAVDVVIPGGADPSQPHALLWVYDSVLGTMVGYLDGVPVNSVPEPPLNIVGTGSFFVGGYSPTSPSLEMGALIDEFRLYDRAVPPPEVAATWNFVLSLGSGGPSQPLLDVFYTINPGVPVANTNTNVVISLQNGPPNGMALVFLDALTAAPPFVAVGLGTVWIPPVVTPTFVQSLDAAGAFNLPFQYGSIITPPVNFTYSVWLQVLTVSMDDGVTLGLSNGIAAGDGDDGTAATGTLTYNPDNGAFRARVSTDGAATISVLTTTAAGTTVVAAGVTPGTGGQITLSGILPMPLLSTESIYVRISGTTVVTHIIQC